MSVQAVLMVFQGRSGMYMTGEMVNTITLSFRCVLTVPVAVDV